VALKEKQVTVIQRDLSACFARWLAVFLKPSQERAHTADGQANARICRAVVEVNSVAILSNCIATGEDDIIYVPALPVKRSLVFELKQIPNAASLWTLIPLLTTIGINLTRRVGEQSFICTQN
jgi:hypothetical protein